MSHPLFETHRATLERALAAIATRGFWSPYPEAPSGKLYGETANAEARARFEAARDRALALD